MAPYYSVSLAPSISDWDWIPGAPDISKTTSQMYFGALNQNVIRYAETTKITMPVLLSS